MKRPGKVLDEFFGRVPKSSQKQMEDAYPRMWDRIWVESQASTGAQALDVDTPQHRRSHWTLVAAAAAALVLIAGIAHREIRERYYAAQVAIEVLDGALLRLSDQRTVNAGERVEGNEVVRSNDSVSIVLADGSRVEMRAHSELSVEHADDGVRIHLRAGGLIVNAAKQLAGHLYVQTRDVTVSVVGTVFLVNAEEEGSRVAVIEGEVRVQQGGTTKNLLAGEQLTTDPMMKLLPVKEELSWSRRAEVHLALQEAAVSSTATKRLEFEVASIKPEPPSRPEDTGPWRLECLGVDGRLGSSATQGAPLGRCIGRHVSLMWLIGTAYGLGSNAPGRIIQSGYSKPNDGPGMQFEPWISNLWDFGFQIEAKAENPAGVTKEQLQQMLESLLAERFKLKVTREMRQVRELGLLVTKGGPKLQAAATEDTVRFSMRTLDGNRQIRVAGNGPMKAFAAALEPYIVVDKTDLKGTYAFDFSFLVPIPPPREGGARGGGGGAGGGSPESAPWFMALQEALQDQIGLRLEYVNVPAEFILIDHVEKPSEN